MCNTVFADAAGIGALLLVSLKNGAFYSNNFIGVNLVEIC